MTVHQVKRAARMWNLGQDTQTIANCLSLTEPVIWKKLTRIRMYAARLKRYREL